MGESTTLRQFVDRGAHVCPDGHTREGSSLGCAVCRLNAENDRLVAVAVAAARTTARVEAHNKLLEDMLDVVTAGLDCAVDHLDEEGAAHVRELMEDRGVLEILGREIDS